MGPEGRVQVRFSGNRGGMNDAFSWGIRIEMVHRLNHERRRWGCITIVTAHEI